MARFRPASARDAALIFLRPVRIAVVAVLALCAAASAAQAWTTQISGEVGVHDWWRRIVRDPAGDLFAIAGPTTEKRAGSNGALLWSVTASDEAGVYDHEPTTDPSGNLLVVATRRATGEPQVVVSKRSGRDGRRLWRFSDTSGLQEPLPPLVDARGDVMVFGRIGNELAAFKIDGATGARRWVLRLPAVVGPGSAAIDASGDVAVTGAASLGGLPLVAKISGGDGTRLWVGTLHRGDSLRAVGFDPAGDILVAGARSLAFDKPLCLVVKLDGATGGVRWRDLSIAGEPVNARVDTRGGIVVSGWVRSRPGPETLVARWNADGTPDWQRTLPFPSAYDHLMHLAVSRAAVVVGGQDLDALGISKAFVFALAADDGRDLWHVQGVGDGGLEGYEPSETIDVLADGDASVLVSLSVADEGSGFDTWIAKLALADGSPRWRLDSRATTTQADDYAKSLVVDPNGDLIAGGILGSPASGRRGAAVKLSASDGRVLWRTTLDRLHGEAHAAVDPAGDVFVTGFVKTAPEDPDPRFGYPAPVAATVVKLNGDDGQEAWRYLHASSVGGAIVGVPAVDRVGDVFAAIWGGAHAGWTDAQVVKIDGERGVATWTTMIARQQVSKRPAPVVVDGAGDVFAGANTLSPAVAKLDGESGAILWQVALPGGAEVAALATAPGGDVLMAVDEPGQPGRRVVRRLLGTSGAVLWSTDLGAGRSKAIALDRFGAVVVAGARGQSNGSLMSVVKLDGTTGAVRWEHGGGIYGSANALTIGGAGNVFVAGSVLSGGAVRFSVRALRGTDGALSWSQSFVTGAGPSAAHAVTLDVAGRAVAAGALAGDTKGFDFGVVSVVPGQAPPTCRFPRLCGG